MNPCCGNYSKEETIQGRKLYEEIRYLDLCHFSLAVINVCSGFAIFIERLREKSSIFALKSGIYFSHLAD